MIRLKLTMNTVNVFLHFFTSWHAMSDACHFLNHMHNIRCITFMKQEEEEHAPGSAMALATGDASAYQPTPSIPCHTNQPPSPFPQHLSLPPVSPYQPRTPLSPEPTPNPQPKLSAFTPHNPLTTSSQETPNTFYPPVEVHTAIHALLCYC